MTPQSPVQTRTLREQHRASDPTSSAWVRANAGSGKTHVLTERVIRLLLSGVAPSRILCLTFTKAAAANMSMRVFDKLASWTTMEDQNLGKEIAATGATPTGDLDLARRLFVRTVETPGGLKVQTIHAFCERLLHLFPFEANTSARFDALDDEMKSMLLEEAQTQVMNECQTVANGPLARALAVVAAETGGYSFGDLLRKAVSMRKTLAAPDAQTPDHLRARLKRWLGLGANDTHDSIITTILDGAPFHDLKTTINELGGGSATDRSLSEKLREALAQGSREEGAKAYLDCYFKRDGEPVKRLGTKSVSASARETLALEQTRLLPLLDKLRAAATVERTMAIHTIATAVFERYAYFKNLRGLLDFDDMIERARTLLMRSDASWILYKLDAGVDHILVDEAQDTSPAQWDILNRLTEEFFAGLGAHERPRTFFAVGDEKQSIFSFQGAAPREFGANRRLFSRRISASGGAFADVELKVSFRSSPEILHSVDTIFANPANRAGLTNDDNVAPVHEAWRAQLPGLVEVWPLIAPEARPTPRDWRLPLDTQDERSPAAAMAERVAETIAALLNPAGGQAVHDRSGTPRPVRAGDIMVLVRKRSEFFECMIRALKERDIPVAGADRLNIIEHIAVMDLVAAGRAALTPDDDLTIATVLKSPLIGLDDDDLLDLAPCRSGSLVASLEQSLDPRHRHAAETLHRWNLRARSGSAFDFYARMLGMDGGRRALLSRLGQEANDAIDEFLRLALEAGRQGVPALAQFLARLVDAELEIKRDMEEVGDTVRVMTVHAAKGLEAKIVFLPDTCSRPGGGHAADLIEMPLEDARHVMIWRKSRSQDPQVVRHALEALEQAEAEEHRRLLYVALTRAEERLYIGGFHGVRVPSDASWYRVIEGTLGEQAQRTPASWDRNTMVLRFGSATILDSGPSPPAAAPKPEVPEWLWRQPAHETAQAPPVRPSFTLAAADEIRMNVDAPGDGGVRIGRLMHDLLQYLPDMDANARPDAAMRYMTVRGAFLSQSRREQLVASALSVLNDPALSALFGPGSRAEVTISGYLNRESGDQVPVLGRIDRLVATGNSVLVADFKTGRPRTPEETPPAYVRQLAIYRAILRPIFPDHVIRTLLIWTGGPEAVEFPDQKLDQALQKLL